MTNRHALTIAISLLASSSLAAETGHAASTSQCPELSGQYTCRRVVDDGFTNLTVQQRKNADNSIKYSLRFYDSSLPEETTVVNAANDVVRTRYPNGIQRSVCGSGTTILTNSGDSFIEFSKKGKKLVVSRQDGDSDVEMIMQCNRVGKAK